EPDKKYRGWMMPLEMLPNPSNVFMRVAMTTPSAVTNRPMEKMMSHAKRSRVTVSGTPTTGAKASGMEPWITEMEAPPSSLPSATDSMGAGDTNTSRRMPTSRSHTM